jgi:hypothetical protein
VRFLNFGGLRPKRISQKLQHGQAEVAINLDLYDGTLRGFGEPGNPRLIVNPDTGEPYPADAAIRTLYRAGSTWVGFTEFTWVVPDTRGALDFDRFLFVRDGRIRWQSEKRMAEGCAPVAIGTCPPAVAPTAQPMDHCGRECGPDMEPALCCVSPTRAPGAQQDCGPQADCLPDEPILRGYRFTWERAYPCCESEVEESAPSPITMVDVRNGEDVYLTTNEQAPAGTTAVNWYRSVVGTEGQVVWLHVGRAPGSKGALLDGLDPIDLGEPLTTEEHFPPPACIDGIALGANSRLVAWHGRTIYASHPFAPYAWDEDRQVVELPYHVVGAIGITHMLEQAEETYLTHVMTDGKPFVLHVPTPDRNMDPRELQVWEPCVSRESICDMRGRSGYASPRGFIRVGSEGVENVTDGWMTEREWGQRRPDQARAVFWHERLWLGWPDRYGLAITLSADDGTRPRQMVEHTVFVGAWFARADVDLWLAPTVGNHALQWGYGPSMRWTWRPALTVHPQLWHPVIAKVVFDDGHHWDDINGPALQVKAAMAADPTRRRDDIVDEMVTANPRLRPYAQQLRDHCAVTMHVMRGRKIVDSVRFRVTEYKRLRRSSRALEWTVQLEGYAPVREVHLSQMVRDLALGDDAQGDQAEV